MAKSATSRPSARVVQLRKGATLEMVRLTCPDAAQAMRIAESFGTAVVDGEHVLDLGVATDHPAGALAGVGDDRLPDGVLGEQFR